MSEEKAQGKKKLLAAIQIRGSIGARQSVKDTLKMLNLHKRNSCIIIEGNPVNKGMLNKCKDYITYGEVSEDTIKKMAPRMDKGKKYYSLHPPRGGFERKGTKKSYAEKGSLGYRGEKINDLILKMM